MTGPADRHGSGRRADPDDDLAVPRLDLMADLTEGLGAAVAALFPHEPDDDAVATWRAAPVRRGDASGSRPDRKSPSVLHFPSIAPVTPLGPSPDSPMGEGSEDTAVPVVDPVEVRLGTMRAPTGVPGRPA